MAKSAANRDRAFVTQARTMRIPHYMKQFRLEVERVLDRYEQLYREISARDEVAAPLVHVVCSAWAPERQPSHCGFQDTLSLGGLDHERNTESEVDQAVDAGSTQQPQQFPLPLAPARCQQNRPTKRTTGSPENACG